MLMVGQVVEPLVPPADFFTTGGVVPPGVGHKTQVEAIYGWRFPLTEQEAAQER